MAGNNPKVVQGIGRRMAPNLFFYSGALLIVIIGEHWYRQATPSELLWILKPVTVLVGLFYGSVFNFQAGLGYMEHGGLVISKACSGMHFFLIHFLMLVFLYCGQFQRLTRKAAVFFVFLVFSYLATIVVNACRVIGMAYLLKLPFLDGFLARGQMHRVFGLLVYSFFMVCNCLAIQKISETGRSDG